MGGAMNRLANRAVINGLLRLLIAAAMVAAALGSGNPATVEPLPDWVNVTSNLLCLLIAAMVLIPRLQLWAAGAAAAMMGLSMITNYAVDGPAYFWLVLPFNLGTLACAALLWWRVKRP